MKNIKPEINILLIDDNPLELGLIGLILQKNLPMVNVSTLTKPPDWESYLPNNKFDAIVIDYRLPERNGLEEIKLLRRFSKDIPVFLITALERDEIDQDIIKAGATDLIVKDRNYSNLITKLNNILIEKSLKSLNNKISSINEILDLTNLLIIKLENNFKCSEIYGNSLSLLGKNKKVLLDYGWLEIFINNKKLTEINEIERALKEIKLFYQEEPRENYISILIDGKEKSFKVNKVQTKSGWYLVLEDVTSIKILRQELSFYQRTQNIGFVTSGVIHDINNLLTTILSYITFLQAIEIDDAYKEYLTKIKLAAIRGSDLTNRILNLIRKSSNLKKNVNLNNLIQDVVEILKGSISKSIELEMELKSNLPPVSIDQPQATQLVFNLIYNAIEALKGKGKITITTSSQKLRISETEEKDYVKFVVEDSGIGLSESEIEKIFNPLYSSNDKNSGSGIGLYIVKKITEENNGIIKCESKKNLGTKFIVFLPVSKETVTEEKKERESLIHSDKTILIIEDEEDIKDFLVTYLAKLGYKAYAEKNGAAGIKFFLEKQNEVDLVIIDYSLPDVNTFEILREMKSQKPSLKVILISGYVFPEIEQKENEILFDLFITKPFVIEEFTEQIAKVLAK